MTQIKPHDWFATRLLNLDKPIEFLFNEGVTTATADLQSRDTYKNIGKVQEMFTNEEGYFDEKAYNKFYDQIALEYEYLSSVDAENFIYDSYEKSWSDFTTPFGKQKNPTLSAQFVANPYDQSVGIVWESASDPEISSREGAQENQYFDRETGTWSKETVNELGAWGLLTDETLVYATYDTDIYDDSGKLLHRKGEWKTDEFGNFYTEKAGNRENIGKQFVTLSEVLTDDKGAWNKIDIFDSDDLDSSAIRTTFRGIATVAALYCPWLKIGKAMSLITAAVNFAKSMPQVSKTLTGFFSEDVQFNKLNTWDNYMKKFSISSTDYAQDNFFSLENVIDLAADSFAQLAQQRAIGEIPKDLGMLKSGKINMEQARIKALLAKDPARQSFLLQNAEVWENLSKTFPEYRKAEAIYKKAEKISSAISRSYMVVTSAGDSYNMAREYGFDTQASSVISLATYAGLGALFSTDYFRGMLYNTSDYELQRDIRVMMKSYLKNNAEKMSGQLAQATTDSAKKTLYKKWGNSIVDFFKQHVSDVKSGKFSITQGMMSEAVEELSEEIWADIAIQVGKGWNNLKSLFTGKEYTNNYNYWESNPLSRYGTALFGGAIGGGIFKLSDRLLLNKASYANWKAMLNDNSQLSKEFVRLISQGKADLMLQELDILEETPILSTKISAFDKNVDVANPNESQNAVLFGLVRKGITDLDNFLSNNNLKIDYDQFGNIEILRGIRASLVNAKGLQDSLFEDYQKFVSQISELYSEIQTLRSSITDNMEDSEKSEIQDKIADKQQQIKSKIQKVKKLVNGEDESYIGRLALSINKNLSSPLNPNSKDSLAYKYYGTEYDRLSKSAKNDINAKYQKIQDSGKSEIDWYELWDVYKRVSSNDELKKSFKAFQDKIGDLNIELTGTTISDLGRITGLNLQAKTMTKESLYGVLSMLLTNMEDSEVMQHATNTILLSMLGISQVVNQNIRDEIMFEDISEDFSFVGDSNILKLSDDAIARITQLITDAKEVINNTMEAQVKGEEYNVPNNIIGALANMADPENAIESLDELLQILPTLQLNLDEGIDVNNINTSDEFNAILQQLYSMFGINDDVMSLINLELQRERTLGKDYTLDDITYEKLKNYIEFLNTIMLIISGSYDNYRFLHDGIPFGANNYLNQVFKDKKIDLDFLQLDKNTLGWFQTEVYQTINKLEQLMYTSDSNRGDSEREDRVLSLKLSYGKLLALKQLSIDGMLETGINSIDLSAISMPDLTELPDDKFTEYAKTTRKLLLDFENQFYTWWSSLTSNSKKDFLQKLFAYCRNNSWVPEADTSMLSTSESEVFKDVDVLHYLISVSLNHIAAINTVYKEYVEQTTNIPYDGQEEIIKSVLRFALGSNNDDLELWMSNFDNSAVNVVSTMCKMICYGGTGKSSEMIPAIWYGIQRINPNKRCVFVANNESQLTTLKQSTKKYNLDGVGEPIFQTIPELLKLVDDELNFQKHFENSILLIDECTYLSMPQILQLDQLAKKYNTRVILSGDTSQTGHKSESTNDKNVYGNVDALCAYSTLTLADSKRAYSDIQRINIRVLSSLRSHEGIKIKYNLNQAGDLLYYENDTIFEGIKFDVNNDEAKSLTKDYVIQFIQTHNIPTNVKILLFTENASEFDDVTFRNEFPNITITSKFQDIQGLEWDYVFTDVNLNVRDDDTLKDVYTLFTRPIHGLISLSKLDIVLQGEQYIVHTGFRNKKTKFPPSLVEISEESKQKFKDFKKEILSVYTNEIKPIKDVQTIDPKVIESGTDVMENQISGEYSVAQISPGFVYNNWYTSDIFPEHRFEDIINILYNHLVSNSSINALPQILQNGKFRIKFQYVHEDQIVNLGNLHRDDKSLGGVNPWLVWSVDELDIPIALFHNPETSREHGLPISKATSDIFKLVPDLPKGEGGRNFEPIYFDIPKTVTFSRANNVISIQDAIGDTETSVVYRAAGINGKASIFTTASEKIEGVNFLTVSTPIYFNTQISLESHGIPMKEISEALKDQEELYKALFTNVEPLLNTHFFDDLLKIVGYDRDGTYRPKYTPTVSNKFVTFVQLSDGSNNELDIETGSQQYLHWIRETNKWLQQCVSIMQSSEIEEVKLNQLKSILKNSVQGNTSMMVFTPESVNDSSEIKNIIDNLTIDNLQANSYNYAVAIQMYRMLHHVLYVGYTNIRSKKDDFINKNDSQAILEELGELTDIESRISSVLKTYTIWYQETFNEQLNESDVLQNLLEMLYNLGGIVKKSDMTYEHLSKFYKLLQKDTIKNLLSDIYSQQLIPDLNKFCKKCNVSYNAHGTLKLHVFDHLIQNNGICIFTPFPTPVKIEKEGELYINGKVIQRAQIHMYVPSDVDFKLELNETPAEEITTREIVEIPSGNNPNDYSVTIDNAITKWSAWGSINEKSWDSFKNELKNAIITAWNTLSVNKKTINFDDLKELCNNNKNMEKVLRIFIKNLNTIINTNNLC